MEWTRTKTLYAIKAKLDLNFILGSFLFLCVAPSRETLAKIDVIKKSSVQFLERANTLEDSDDEDEDYLKDPEKKKVLETTLRNYYMTLVSSNGNNSAAAAGTC